MISNKQWLAGLILASSLAASGTLSAQNAEPSLQAVLSRYAGAVGSAPTVDRELAQRLFRRGNTYSNLERFEQAIEEFEESIVADPNFAEARRRNRILPATLPSP